MEPIAERQPRQGRLTVPEATRQLPSSPRETCLTAPETETNGRSSSIPNAIPMTPSPESTPHISILCLRFPLPRHPSSSSSFVIFFDRQAAVPETFVQTRGETRSPHFHHKAVMRTSWPGGDKRTQCWRHSYRSKRSGNRGGVGGLRRPKNIPNPIACDFWQMTARQALTQLAPYHLQLL